MKRIVCSLLALCGVGMMMQTEANAQMYVIKEGKVKVALEETPDYIVVESTQPDSKTRIIKDGKVKVDLSGQPDYITFKNPMSCGGIVGDEVDMGLSVKWSSVNVGASNPQDAGKYYAWGETKSKETYDWSTYSFETKGYSDENGINKYHVKDGYFDAVWYKNVKYTLKGGKTELEAVDDAAAFKWQGGWAVPTAADWEELIDNCYVVWTTKFNGKNVSGFIFYKAKKTADKGMKVYYGEPSKDYDVTQDDLIFLPMAGWRQGMALFDDGSNGYYWTSTLSWGLTYNARCMAFSQQGIKKSTDVRSCGMLIRPVCSSEGSTNEHDAVDLGLPSGKKWATCNLGASFPEVRGDYFAWGETSGKGTYTWDNYTGDTAEFVGDNKVKVEASDDVATQNWGDDWRMPTMKEWQELYDNTTQEWTDNYNGTGVKGYILTSKVKGHTDAQIFLPAVGCREVDKLIDAGSNVSYWAQSLSEETVYGDYALFVSGVLCTRARERCNGLPVRPVKN